MTNAVNIAQIGSNNTTFRNKIINGAQVIDQRNAGASVTAATAAYTYITDRFKVYSTGASKLSGQGTTTAPSGFTNSLAITSLAATSPAAGDEYQLYHNIEGYNIADLGWGTASAQTVTLSFWARSSLTGTFAGCLYNNGGSRCYVFTYTISAANTFEYKSITIAGDTSGTWLTTNLNGINITWDLGSGSNLNGTAGVWASAFDSRTSGSVTLIGTNGATFYITGVQLEAGSAASPFEYRPITTELQLCQRYFATSFQFGTAPANNTNYLTNCTNTNGATYTANACWTNPIPLPVTMRTYPTAIALYSSTLANTAGQWSYFNGSAWLATTAIGLANYGEDTFTLSIVGTWAANSSILILGGWTASAEL